MVYTPDKLAEMTHEQGDRILLAILGEVYDVSKNPAYYGARTPVLLVVPSMQRSAAYTSEE